VDEPNPKIALVCTRENARVLRLVSQTRARRPLAPSPVAPRAHHAPAPAHIARHTIRARPNRPSPALSNARDAHPKNVNRISPTIGALSKRQSIPQRRPRPAFTATRATHIATHVPSHSAAVSPPACARAHQPRARRRPPSTWPSTSSSVQKMRSSEHEGDDVVGVVHRSMLREMKTTTSRGRVTRGACAEMTRATATRGECAPRQRKIRNAAPA